MPPAWQQAALAGHSMGSLIALEAARAARPSASRRLVMLGTAYPMTVPKALLELSIAAPLKAIDRVVCFSFSTLAAKPSYPGPGVWLRGARAAADAAGAAAPGRRDLFHHDFAACDRYAGGLEAAAQVRCPAHLVLGARRPDDADRAPRANSPPR